MDRTFSHRDQILGLPSGWLIGPAFDTVLIGGVAALALTTGAVSVLVPALFGVLLLADLWFLGYHHVIATFTRLAFDAKSYQEYKFLVLWLPVFVAVGVVAAVWVIGPWVLATTYLYWQWYHYMRQGYGISRIYQCKANPSVGKIDEYLLYALPVAGILYRSYQAPGHFLGMELKVLPVSWEVAQAAIAVAIIAVIWWAFRQYRFHRQGKVTGAYLLFTISYFLVFAVGYILISDINFGWLVMNVWHNAQYIMFVWMFHNKRFKNAVDPEHAFLSTLALRKNQWRYYAFCLALTTLIYLPLSKVLSSIQVPEFATTFPLVLIFYQTLNFHHYIVDAIIWKVRKKPIQKTLEIVV